MNTIIRQTKGRISSARDKHTQDSADNGFTLIELIIVVVIIAVLGAIAVPLYNNFQDSARDAAVQEDLRVFKDLRDSYTLVEGYFSPSAYMTDLNFQPSLVSYETEDTDHNLVYCHNTGDNEHWGMLALSKSGNAFYVSSTERVTKLGQSGGERTSRPTSAESSMRTLLPTSVAMPERWTAGVPG